MSYLFFFFGYKMSYLFLPIAACIIAYISLTGCWMLGAECWVLFLYYFVIDLLLNHIYVFARKPLTLESELPPSIQSVWDDFVMRFTKKLVKYNRKNSNEFHDTFPC